MTNGLGFNIELPPARKGTKKESTIDVGNLPPVVDTAAGLLRYTGTIPTLLIFAISVLLSSVLLFGDINLHSPEAQAMYITFPLLGAILYLITPAVGIIYAGALGVHTTVEAHAVDLAIGVIRNETMLIHNEFYVNSTTNETITISNSTYTALPTDFEMGTSWVGLVLVIGHMIPFYIFATGTPLRILAAVGVGVNSALAMFLADSDPAHILLFQMSSFFLLSVMLLYDGPALGGMILNSFRTNKWITK